MATLLYVDDEETIGRLVSRYFAKRGDRVFLARSIPEAQLLLSAQEPDIIFIDVWLGRERGVDLVRWIAAQRPQLTNRVTFVTGDLLEDANAGAFGGTIGRPVIQKPFELATLARCIDAAGNRAGT